MYTSTHRFFQRLHSYSSHCSPYSSYDMDMENVFENQEFLKSGIISFILMTFTYDSRVILQREIRSQSPLETKELKNVP